MKQVNIAHQEAYQELLTVTKWTVQMLDQGDIVYGGNSVNPHSYNEFCNWAAAVRAAVAKAEIGDGSDFSCHYLRMRIDFKKSVQTSSD